MLARCLLLKRPIRLFLEERLTSLKISDECWELAEILCAFLMPFYRCTKRFESNAALPEIDYVFFAYNIMYDHIDDVKEALKKKRGIEAYAVASFMSTALNKMEDSLKKYYAKMDFSSVYADAMILNSRCKFSIFEENTRSHEDADKYSRRVVNDLRNTTSLRTI